MIAHACGPMGHHDLPTKQDMARWRSAVSDQESFTRLSDQLERREAQRIAEGEKSAEGDPRKVKTDEPAPVRRTVVQRRRRR